MMINKRILKLFSSFQFLNLLLSPHLSECQSTEQELSKSKLINQVKNHEILGTLFNEVVVNDQVVKRKVVANRDVHHHQNTRLEKRVLNTVEGERPSKKMKTSTEDHVKEASKENFFSTLTDDLKLEIVKKMGLKDTSLLKLKQTNKDWASTLAQFKYSKYSVIGSIEEPYDDYPLCDFLKENQEYYKHIRELYLTLDTWQNCDFKAEKLVNVEVIHIHVTSIEELGAPEMLDVWEPISEDSYKSLRSLEVFGLTLDSLLHFLLVSEIPKVLTVVEQKLQTGLLNVNAKNEIGLTPLHVCLLPDLLRIRKGSYFDTEECIKLLIKYGANPNEMNSLNFTPVHFAAALEYSEPLKILVKHEGDLNFSVRKSTLTSYKNKPSPFECFENTETPFHISLTARTDKPLDLFIVTDIADKLTEEHYGFESTEEDLEFWRQKRNHAEFKKNLPFYTLLNHQVDLTVQSEEYGTPLNFAIANKQSDYAAAILDVNYLNKEILEMPDIDGNTPLILAWREEITDIFYQLVRLGANIHAQNEQGEGLLHFIDSLRFPQTDQLKKLLRLGVDINSIDNYQMNILHKILIPNEYQDVQQIDISNDLEDDQLFDSEENMATNALLLIVNKGIDLHRRDFEQYSGLFLVLDHIAHKKIRSPTRNGKYIELLKSVIEHVNFGAKLEKEGDKFDALHVLDAHLLLFTVFKSGNRQLQTELLRILPEFIKRHFEHPFVGEEGLLFSDAYKQDSMNIYSHIDDRKNSFNLFKTMSNLSPSIFDLVKSFSLTHKNFLENKFIRAKQATQILIYDFDNTANQHESLSETIEKAEEYILTFPDAVSFQIFMSTNEHFLEYVLREDLYSGKLHHFQMISKKLFEALVHSKKHLDADLLQLCVSQNVQMNWCIDEFLGRGVDLNIQDNQGYTALHAAIEVGNDYAIQYLIQLGASLDTPSSIQLRQKEKLPDFLGITPLHLAMLLPESKRETIKIPLLKKANDLTKVDGFGKTPLRYAVINGDFQTVQFILGKFPESLFKVGFDGQSVLMDAIQLGDAAILELLLHHAKDNKEFLEHRNKDGLNAYDLTFCSANPNSRIKSLLEAHHLYERPICDKIHHSLVDAIQKNDRELINKTWKQMVQDGSFSDHETRWRWICISNPGLVYSDRLGQYLWELFFQGNMEDQLEVEQYLKSVIN